jgi:hypothetical protein
MDSATMIGYRSSIGCIQKEAISRSGCIISRSRSDSDHKHCRSGRLFAKCGKDNVDKSSLTYFNRVVITKDTSIYITKHGQAKLFITSNVNDRHPLLHPQHGIYCFTNWLAWLL